MAREPVVRAVEDVVLNIHNRCSFMDTLIKSHDVNNKHVGIKLSVVAIAPEMLELNSITK